MNSARPAAISAEIDSVSASPYFRTMSDEIVEPWPSRMRKEKLVLNEMIMATAMVSPSARPRPSMTPPITPPRPNGSTTARITPQRVAPSASAPSFSPIGAWPNTSRLTEQQIGMTIVDTTTPEMNSDELNWLSTKRAFTSIVRISKIGRKSRFVASHRLTGISWGCSTKKPKTP